jgi:predicted ATP-grasp superfamily ATP-dependent carboligase
MPYELVTDLPELHNPVLLYSLDGFIDAGAAGRLLRDHILETLEHRVIATFDIDQFIDYRARRPTMTYDKDRWEDYQAPELVLHLVHDGVGEPFLLLSGPEPDRSWEAFVGAVRSLVDRFDVRLAASFQGVPMAAPHTRPLGITMHGTRPELLTGRRSWFGRVQIPGSASALLELRLGEAGRDAVGFAVHVPHYLAQAAYPAAAIKALEAVTSATGLMIPGPQLREAAEKADAEINEQVAGSDEIAGVIQGLEQQYDAFMDAQAREDLQAAAENMPTGDELAAQFERFLAEQNGRGDGT